MSRVPSQLVACLISGIGACGSGPGPVEDGEWLPGGETTNTLLLGSNAFLRPASNLSDEHEQAFYSGNAFFNQGWVEAPASTTARDGLGPLFNARSCSGCHFKDGRAEAPEDGPGPFVGTLIRLSVPDPQGGEPLPEPTYGGQLQDDAIPDVPVEGVPSVSWTEESGTYDDGTPYTLRRPAWSIGALAHGPMQADVMLSARVAPQMIGLGLLEAIPAARIEALADPDDADGDGVRGVVQRSVEPDSGDVLVGRFGWKAEMPTVRGQTEGAFNGDMGLTTAAFPVDDCTASQTACLSRPDGRDEEGPWEVQARVLDNTALYAAAVAVPGRRNWEDKEVRRGKALFRQLGCDRCHVPSHTTGSFEALPELGGQTIWPYTDLLLHDLGEGLSDGRPVGEATATMWKTPPLWGLGLIPDVNGHHQLLHDGRARGFAEAILWHGGEAADSRDAFKALSVEDRERLISFLEDL